MKTAPVLPTAPAGDRVIITRRLDAPFDAAWAALTDPMLVSQWLTDCTALSTRRFALRFTDDDGDYVKTVELTRLRYRPNRASYRVRLQDPGYPDSMITVALQALGNDASTVRLTHHDPPRQLVAGYRTGWRDYLDELAQLLSRTYRTTCTDNGKGTDSNGN